VRQLSLAIVGIGYPNKRGPTRRFELALCTPGEPIELRPEPHNQHDEHAIAVFSCRGVQLGYLNSDRAVWIGTLIRRDVEVKVIFGALAETVAYCRVAFNGEEPTLTGVAHRASLEEGQFWPDEEGGTWGA